MTAVEATSRLEAGPGGYPVINASHLPSEVIRDSDSMIEIASKLSRWIDNARSASTRTTMFDRGAYTPPDNPYDEMLAARAAVDRDDIVGGVQEVTEAFAFQGVKWEGENADEADIFNQISRDLNLDAVIRRMWKEEYTYSQFVVASRWGWRTYRVRGRTKDGNRRKKEYTIYCPVSLHIIDATKVVPVGHTPLGSMGLAWCSNNTEVEHFVRMRRGETYDPVMDQFFIGTYDPPLQEKRELSKMGVDVKNLLVMNPGLVWQHTATKPDYERFPTIRLKSIFKHLDLKQQQVNADRSMLIGAANYILVIRKGTDDLPAKKEEIEALKKNYNFIAKLPVIISDHRLEVDIVAPKTDFVLQAERYDLLDTRLLMRLLGTLSLGARGQRNETNVTISRAVARNMENRRHLIKRTIEEKVARAVYFHPRNAMAFEEGNEPNLVFVPRNIALDIDAAMVQAIMGLRTQREISRETILEYFGLDQATEAQRREMEAEFYDDTFKTAIPFNAPANNDSGSDPADPGGRPPGGGQNKQDSTKPKQQTKNGNPSTGSN